MVNLLEYASGLLREKADKCSSFSRLATSELASKPVREAARKELEKANEEYGQAWMGIISLTKMDLYEKL